MGRFKARFFLGLSYLSEEWSQLEADLRNQHLTQDATLTLPSPYGQKYEMRAPLLGPAGRKAELVSV